MSLAGINLIQSIQALVQAQRIDEASALISQQQNPQQAATLYEYLYLHPNPKTWIAFLKNDALNTILLPKQLSLILSFSHQQLQSLPTTDPDRPHWQRLMKVIAKNQLWCQMLSYAKLLDYVCDNDVLAKYIAEHASFLLHLDYFQVGKFVKARPLYHLKVLDIVLDVFENDKSKTLWAQMAIQSIVLGLESAIRSIKNDKKYDPLFAELEQAFKTDKAFALEVLKHPILAKRLLGFVKIKAYKHPLFGLSEYDELAQHFRSTHPQLSTKYVSFKAQYIITERDVYEQYAKLMSEVQEEFSEEEDVLLEEDEIECASIIYGMSHMMDTSPQQILTVEELPDDVVTPVTPIPPYVPSNIDFIERPVTPQIKKPSS